MCERVVDYRDLPDNKYGGRWNGGEKYQRPGCEICDLRGVIAGGELHRRWICLWGEAWKLLTEEILSRKCDLMRTRSIDESPSWHSVEYMRLMRLKRMEDNETRRPPLPDYRQLNLFFSS